MKKMTIGVLGGMGTYASIHLFQQYAEVFPAEKEWERPRILIDNRCTMPSRVCAFLYGEKREQLITEMTESLENLLNAGCTRLILACNTSHLFLPDICKRIPNLNETLINIIDCCVEKIESDGIREVYLLGSEGTINSQVYQNALRERGIVCYEPVEEEYLILRQCIEAVKQNKNFNQVREAFLSLVNRYDACILGCTELPILYQMFHDAVGTSQIYDPLLIVLNKLKGEYDNE